MKTVEALPVCGDCNCVMFKKSIQASRTEKALTGWSCPECFTSKWEWVNG